MYAENGHTTNHETALPLTEDSQSDEAKKSYWDILQQQVREELTQLSRPSSGLLISGLSAGLDVGFSLLLMAIMYTLTVDVIPEAGLDILIANMYSVGFIFVILGRSELFTEHTTLAFLPVLSRHASLRSLLRLWGLIYSSNLVGAAIFALIASFVGPALGIIEPRAFAAIARPMVEPEWWVILVSGTLAGWLMGLLSWLVTASRDTISQIVIVWLVTTAIGLAHLHHSIVGTVEVLAAIFSQQGVTWGEFGHFLLWTTLGNVLGGLVFVALIKYGHASQQGEHVNTT
ncbi:MAG: formate/nitrite transporter family protein [Chloroflexaceae bacterium]|nr:formate/nitrite transporter family protein [Chloroflexaceae bacterium]NJO05146.1 formate/nitrite transporter family protein [Chloroflexaceae bacterium]